MAKRTVRKRVTRKPVEPRYLYVETRGWFRTETDDFNDDRKFEVLDGPISFDSIVVRAANDDEAYNIGAAKLQDQQANDPELTDQETGEGVDGSHMTGRFLNDYVVRL